MNSQDAPISHLLRLPCELRDMIYGMVFDASRLRYGIVYEDLEWVDRNATGHQPERPEQRGQQQQQRPEDWVLTEKSYRYVRPARHTLALLSTCRQVHAETRDLWLSRVLFAFNSAEDMLDRLSPLPRDVVSRIRHVQLAPAHSGVKRYALAALLKALPALNLDTLTVIMSYASRARHACPANGWVLDGLLRHGAGWRKLYFVTPDSLMLNDVRLDLDGGEIHPEWPAAWIDTLAARDWPEARLQNIDGDGEGIEEQKTDADDEKEMEIHRHRARVEAGAKCRIYRATERGAGAALDPRRRAIFTAPKEQEGQQPEWLSIENRTERKAARAAAVEASRAAERGERARELLVVVERRRGVDVAADQRPLSPPSSFCPDSDFRAFMAGKSWHEYWRGGEHVFRTAMTTPHRKLPDLIDHYDSPYEFRWVAGERKGVTWPVNA